MKLINPQKHETARFNKNTRYFSRANAPESEPHGSMGPNSYGHHIVLGRGVTTPPDPSTILNGAKMEVSGAGRPSRPNPHVPPFFLVQFQKYMLWVKKINKCSL